MFCSSILSIQCILHVDRMMGATVLIADEVIENTPDEIYDISDLDFAWVLF